MSAQSKLIDLIFERHGGIVKVAKKVKVSKQLVLIWRNKGYVPLTRVNEVAKILKVPAISLNYKEYSRFLIEMVPWDSVVNDCTLSLEAITC